MRHHPGILGVGINDADYSVIKTKCPYYVVWQAMLMRCYSPQMLIKNPSYVGCSVDSSWHLFSTFKSWMMLKDWQGKHLDKDLRVQGNKIYGPDTCLFVSKTINGLLNKGKQSDLPIGVNRCGEKFKVTFKKERKTVHLGVFPSIEKAALAYQKAKADWIEYVASKETCLDTKDALLTAAYNYRMGLF